MALCTMCRGTGSCAGRYGWPGLYGAGAGLVNTHLTDATILYYTNVKAQFLPILHYVMVEETRLVGMGQWM